jgi:hypothetical protein
MSEVNVVATDTLAGKDVRMLFNRALEGERRGERIQRIRIFFAYVFKFIAAGGCLLVAADVWPEIHQGIGIAVLGTVLIDAVTSNHKRLLSEVEAGYAFKFLALNLALENNARLSPLLDELKRVGPTSKRGKELDVMVKSTESETNDALRKGVLQIERDRAAADLKALQAISLDNERGVKEKSP